MKTMRNIVWRRSVKPRRNKGFTLVEMVVVLSIIGVLLATSIAGIMAAIQHAKMVRTEDMIRRVGERWCILFQGDYAPTEIEQPGPDPKTDVFVSDFSHLLTPAEMDQLASLLGVTLARTDAWGQPIEYRVDSWPTPTRLMIRSSNANRRWDDSPSYKHATFFPATEKVKDIVWVNCTWVQFYC